LLEPPVAEERPIYAYRSELCGNVEDEDFDGSGILNQEYPELFPPFSDGVEPEPTEVEEGSSEGEGEGSEGSGGSEGEAAEGEDGGSGARRKSSGGREAAAAAAKKKPPLKWDPFSLDGPPMPLRVPPSMWIYPKEGDEGEGEVEEEGAIDGRRLAGPETTRGARRRGRSSSSNSSSNSSSERRGRRPVDNNDNRRLSSRGARRRRDEE
jgi:hypothetical protein